MCVCVCVCVEEIYRSLLNNYEAVESSGKTEDNEIYTKRMCWDANNTVNHCVMLPRGTLCCVLLVKTVLFVRFLLASV